MSVPTQQEIEILVKFRETISELNMSEEQKTDMSLLAWLRARELDIQKAYDMLKKSLAWRIENDIDNVLNWNPPDSYKKEFPYEVCGQCPDGCPVIVLSFGKWDVRKAVELGQKEIWLRHIDQMFAHTFQAMKNTNKTLKNGQIPVTQCVMIVDFEEYPMRQLTSVSSVQTILETVGRFESNYPETVKAMYFINAPRIFSIFFSIIKPVLSARTLSKVEIFSSNKNKWKPILLANIPSDQLPCVLGGTNMESCQFLSKTHIYSTTNSEVNDDDVDLISISIEAGQEFKLEYDVMKPNTLLIWTFKSEAYDIGFSILYNDKEEVLPYMKYDAHLNKQDGSHTCENLGKYTLIFDNTYSKIRPKNIQYIVNTISSERI